MRKINLQILAIVFGISLFLTSCSQQQVTNSKNNNSTTPVATAPTQPVVSPTPATPPPPPHPKVKSLDEIAVDIAQAKFEQIYTKCGDSYYYDVGYAIKQAKDVSFHIGRNDQLSEVDRLNGIMWRGTVNASCRMGRSTIVNTKKWGDWSPGGTIIIDVINRKSKWEANLYCDCKKTTCAAVAQFH